MADSSAQLRETNTPENNTKTKIAFLSAVTFASVIGGFGLAVGAARKRSPTSFSGQVHDEGAKLAMRALGWGTLLSVSGVTAIGIVGKAIYELKKVILKSMVLLVKVEKLSE